ncbi:hypothetical protein [Luteimonas terrae]|uniref:Uncharacterized protein n=1 Tax=Luteimonas terrae TaxID=1530191 RepID=A0ABU1XXA6_9GAMM|nr:hypothetical protein [Luteimonas terrae]MDR7193343.1 hypothetical protein [Luteimonas terrae]
MTEHHDLEEIRNLPSAELIELLPAVEPGKLAALREAEAADAKPRQAVIDAIDKAIDALPKTGARTETEAAAAQKAQTPAQRKAAEKAAAAAKASDKLRSPAQQPAADSQPATAAATDATPAWQAADYDGPITIPQAEWRRHHIKPAQAVREK